MWSPFTPVDTSPEKGPPAIGDRTEIYSDGS